MRPRLTTVLARLKTDGADHLQQDVIQSRLSDEGRWHGHRTFFVDGSGCSRPDTPALQDAFGQSTVQRPGCGVPMAHLLGLFHVGTGVLLKLVVAPLLTRDLAHVQAVHPSWHAGDVLVGDRGLGSCVVNLAGKLHRCAIKAPPVADQIVPH
jgi:hypothetical protein